MSRLIRGIFNGADPETSLFGLRSGVDKAPDAFVPDAYWFNIKGERLGKGDLSLDDIGRIAAEITEGELFIVLSSGDFYDPLPAFEAEFKAAHFDAGPRYVAKFCTVIVAPRTIYLVGQESDQAALQILRASDLLARVAWASNVEISIISRERAQRMILDHATGVVSYPPVVGRLKK